MAGGVPPEWLKHQRHPVERKFRASASGFALISISVFPVLLLLRAYEYFTVGDSHALPAGAIGLFFRGLRSELGLTLLLAASLAIPILIPGFWIPRAARIIHRILLIVFVLVELALIQYFAVTLVPLGADLFGYTPGYIRETAMSSKGIGLTALFPLLFLGAATWFASGLALRLMLHRYIVYAFLAALPFALVFHENIVQDPARFSSETDYFLAENKLIFFAGRSMTFLAERWSRKPSRLSGYPLLRAAVREDVLGPFLNKSNRKPNLVLVIVEGLGSDFVGKGARLGGFTPFLDSLTDRSLYWENFLSTTGRTFGVLPSLLGSLPFGDRGFMDLGSRMPNHQTIISLLGAAGYKTSYFTGTNGQQEFIDAFMERQGVDHFIDESRFGPGYEKEPASEGGESWGYSDGELFRRSFEIIGAPSSQPRLDVYTTITTHEPFIPPRSSYYRARFESRLSELGVDENRRVELRKSAGIFSTLLYTDDALRYLFSQYAKRADFGNTIFFITGDHRLIPIAPRARIDRFHVPFLVYSSLLKQPRRFFSVSSHLDVAPTLLAFMHSNYGLSLPDSAHWLGTGIDTVQSFRNIHSLALMPNKNQLDTYLDGLNYLSGDQLFRLEQGLMLREVNDPAAKRRAREKLDYFRELNRFVTTDAHLYPQQSSPATEESLNREEDSVFRALDLDRKTPLEAFEVAKRHALAGQYPIARLIVQRLLRDSPSYHDARALLGRTYSWERRFDAGRPILEDLVLRAPEYLDGHIALIDLEIFAERGSVALRLSNSALNRFPRNPEILFRKARSLELLGRKKDAVAVLNSLTAIDPNDPEALKLRERLTK